MRTAPSTAEHPLDGNRPIAAARRAAGFTEPTTAREARALASGRVVRHAGVVLAVQVAGAGLAYGLQVLLARLLGASGYGLYTYLYVWVSFVALLAGLGIAAASVRFVPVYRSAGDWSRLRGFLRESTQATFAGALAVSACVALCVEALHAAGTIAHPSVVLLGALLLPALAGSTLYTELARGGERMLSAFAPPMVMRPLLIGLGALVLLAAGDGLSLSGALLATLLAAYVVLALQYLLVRRTFRTVPSVQRARLERREWFGVGFSLLAATAFVVTLSQVDIVIVGALRGAREAGIYAAASKTATLVAFVLIAVNAAAAPRFASLWAHAEVERLQRLLSRLAGLIFWPSLAVAAGLALLATPLLSLFGVGFAAARPALLVLLVGQLVNAATGSVGYLLTLTGHHREATRALGFSALACVVLAAVGTAALGLTGAALGSTLGFALWNVALHRIVVRRLGMHPSIFAVFARRRPV